MQLDRISKDWKPLFISTNNLANGGILHALKALFSMHFYPEACSGTFCTNVTLTNVKLEQVSYFNYFVQSFT